MLNCGADDDILIAGRTTSDALFSNLNDLRGMELRQSLAGFKLRNDTLRPLTAVSGDAS